MHISIDLFIILACEKHQAKKILESLLSLHKVPFFLSFFLLTHSKVPYALI